VTEFDHKLKLATALAGKRKMSRRDFMQLAAAAGITAATANAMFTKAVRAEPKRGGNFKFACGHGGTTDTLDPGTWTNQFMVNMSVGMWGAQLTGVDPKTAVIPHLAESFEPSDGAKKWVFKLRKGATFHNGKDVTATDVVETYNFHRAEGSKSAVKSALAVISDVKADGPDTVVFTLTGGSADFPYVTSDYHLPIFPAKAGGGIEWEKGVSAGPFILENFEPGVRALGKRNPNYFKAGLPYLERIELNLKVEPAIQMLHWENKEAEMIRNIPPAERDRILNDPEQSKLVRSAAVLSVVRLGIHHKVKPFDDLKVRQAVAMAIDKEAVAQEAGGILPPLEGYFAVPMLEYDKNFKTKYPYDPDKAKALLAEAGHADGIKDITLWGTNQAVVELLQSDLKAVGIDVTLNTEDAGHRDHIRNGEWGLFIYGWAASFPDAFDYVSAWTTCASGETGYNDGMYCDQRIDDLLDKAEKLPQQDPQRIAAYREIEDIVINQDVGFVGLYNEQGRALGVANVHDDFQSNIYSGWPYLETAWMD